MRDTESREFSSYWGFLSYWGFEFFSRNLNNLFLLLSICLLMGVTKQPAAKVAKKNHAAPLAARQRKQPKKAAPRKLKKAAASNVPARALATSRSRAARSSVTPTAPAVAGKTQMRPLAATVRYPNGAPAPSAPVMYVDRSAESRMTADAGLGRMNRQGTSIERIQSGHKNLRPDPPGVASERKAEKFLQRNMKPEDLLSPDAVRYCNLLDDPLNAPWGDQGEVQVRPLVYAETVPPSTTKTIRCFGQAELIVPAGSEMWIVYCVGAGAQGSSLSEGDDLGVAIPVFTPTVGGSAVCGFLGTLGAPNDGRGLAVPAFTPPAIPVTAGLGGGVAGYYYTAPVGNQPPFIETNATLIGGTSPTFLEWGNPVAFGDMKEDDGAAYKFRPVAGGLLITPDETTFELGGHYDAMVIPQATNEPYVSSTGGTLGTSTNVADILALPDHCIQRADDAIMVNWLPGRQDYTFLKSYPSGDVGTFWNDVHSTFENATNARVFVKISPPVNMNAHKYVISYTGFYEVAGQCVQQAGSVPRSSPTIGAKIATSVQNNLNIELDDRSRQVTEGTTLEVMKDHPKIGPMIEQCDSMPKAKSTLSEIIDFGKDLLPLVGMLL